MDETRKLILVIIGLCSLGLFLALYRSLMEAEKERMSFIPLSTPARNVSGISYDGTSLWMTIDGGEVIYQMDPASWEIKRKIDFPVKATGGSAWDGRTLWQLAYEEKKIYQFDLNTEKILKVIPTPGAGQCSGTTFDGQHLWVANFEDKKIYQIDQEKGGEILQTLDGYFEAAGLAWDGKYLWTGILVGTISHDEQTPYTGFVQQKDLETRQTNLVYHIPGVGPGTSSWTAGSKQANVFWWYDGFNNQITKVELREGSTSSVKAMAGALFLLTLISTGMAWKSKTARVAKSQVAGGRS